MSRSASASILFLASTGACSGLVGRSGSQHPHSGPRPRDSAYVRARRALQGESFTLDVVDSSGGRLTGTRYPSSSAVLGSAAACRVRVALQIKGDARQAEVASTSQWVAPGRMSDKAPKICEQERSQVVERTAAVLVPPPTP